MTTTYLAHTYNGKRIEIPTVLTAKDGFWVTECYHFTNGSNAKYWVPPSSIILVEKLSEPVKKSFDELKEQW